MSFIELGHLATMLALGLSVLGFVSAFLGQLWDPAFTRVGRHALHAITLLLLFACGTLIHAFLVSDFSVLYVASNSNSRLPDIFKVAALWGGHEGSLLLWATLLSIFSSLVVWVHWKSDPDFMAPVTGVFSSILMGFLTLVLFLSSPFTRLIPSPVEGRDLNPLLQDIQMAFHPPMLFTGYTGFAVPFAFAMAVLLTGRGADRWIYVSRKWTLIAWLILTAGIALGGHWAYRELGWGGYWAWDAVENASLMPWLIGTALLHSVMVQEQQKTFRVWNMGLAITAFALSILGTFLVRSGIISSVHAFASDPSRGIFLLSFFATVLIVSFGFLIARAERFQEGLHASGMSRESLFLFNNLFLIISMLTVFLGTLFPLIAEAVNGTKVTVAAPFFNKTFVPIMGLNMVLMALAPMLPWRKFGWAQVWRVARWPLLVAALTAIGLWVGGIRQTVPFLSGTVVGFGLAMLIREWSGGGGKVWLRQLTANRRRLGGLTAHLGILVIAVGFAGSRAYQTESDVSLTPGERTQIGNYEVRFVDMEKRTGPNWEGFAGRFDVYKGGDLVTTLNPEKRYYQRSSMPTTEPERYKAYTHELYITLGEVDEQSGSALVKIYLNPLIQLVWAGVYLMVLGGLLGLSHRVRVKS